MVHIARWQITLIIGICVLGLAFALPNLVSRESSDALPDWLPHKQINLGLDLQGGSHLLFEVDTESVVTEHLETVVDSVRQELRKARILFQDLSVQGTSVVFGLRDPAAEDQAREVVRGIISSVSGGSALFGGTGPDLTMEVSEGRFRLSLTEQAIRARQDAAIEQAIEVIRRRVDETGTREPTIQRQGADRILVQLPGIDDPERMKALIGKTAKMTFHLVDEEGMALVRERAPPGSEWLNQREGGGRVLVKKRVMVSGENLTDAQPTFDQGQPVVSFSFDTVGARRFGDVTRQNVGHRFAIVLDDEVISAPNIREPILGGRGIITGGFTVQTAQDLALLLRAGALPAPLKVVEERTVGPGLGADSIEAGKLASLLGLVFVIVFMALYYGRFGVMADAALLINLVLMAGALSALQATLTLPGIAGIVLTIGMAVDANVLIFERIREELRAGRTPISAVDAGYRRALTTIIDSNITTFIAAFLLFLFGTGPIRGFAVTLSIGIATSMFTAVMVTRLMVTSWLRRTRPQSLEVRGPIAWFELVRAGTNIQFISRRVLFFAFSLVLVVVSFGSYAVRDLNYGIDFVGGIMIEAKTQGPADLGAMRSTLSGLDLGEVALQEFGEPDDVLIRVEKQTGGEEEQARAVADIKRALGPGVEYRRTEFVGPKVGGELRLDGAIAVVLAMAAMLIYIWFRFEWQFSVAAVAALVHDVIATIGLFSVLQLEFNLSTLAAILTIAGYSINDTVVVFDRVRENLRKYKKLDLFSLFNKSINETLSRTIMTSGTTLLALVALFFFGGQVIRDFSLAMIWGIVIGTYSSICVAVPLLIKLNLRREALAGGGSEKAAEAASEG